MQYNYLTCILESKMVYKVYYHYHDITFYRKRNKFFLANPLKLNSSLNLKFGN